MSKITKIVIHLFLFLMLIAPVFSLAQTPPVTEGGLVPPCGKTLQTAFRVNGITYQAGQVVPCGFNDLMTLVNSIIQFILLKLAIPIAAIMFFYAGFKMVTSGGSPESRTQAKSIFTNTLLGLVFIAGTWLIIKTILSVLGYEGAWIFDKFQM